MNKLCETNGIENYVIPYRYSVYKPINNPFLNWIKRSYKRTTVSFYNWIAEKIIKHLGILKRIDIIHSNINRDIFGQILSKKYGIPNITSIRELSKAHFQLDLLFKDQLSFMNKYTVKFAAVSNIVKEDWINYGLESSKITTIYDGIVIDKYNQKLKEHHQDFKIVMCGYIEPEKGQLDLIKAVTPLINSGLKITIDFYGLMNNATYLAKIREYINETHLSHCVLFKGYTDNLPILLPNYDLGVICSKAEGFGLVTIEYLLSGLMVIASNTGANTELLKNGEYGLIYQLGNIEDLTNKIRYVYLNKKEWLINSKKNIEYAKKFSSDNTFDNLNALYTEIVNSNL